MRPQGRTVEREIAHIASRRHGVVTRRELLEVGITPAEIKQRLRIGALLREHPGVYRVGHRAPSVEARYAAAVLGCGDCALLCGRAAAHLLGLLPGSPAPPEVVAPTERRLRGVVTRRARTMDPLDAVIWQRIPMTSVSRTIVDLAAVLSLPALARAAHEADVRHGILAEDIEAALERRGRGRGAAKLREVVHGEVRVTLSKLEEAFIARLVEAALPLPETNRSLGGRRLDCRWPLQRLTVELDGYRYHRTRYAWEQDRRREREAYARGDDFRRYTYGDVLEQPEGMLEELRELLA